MIDMPVTSAINVRRKRRQRERARKLRKEAGEVVKLAKERVEKMIIGE